MKNIINLHTKPHNAKQNSFLESKKVYIFRPFAMTLYIELRCIMFPLIIPEMFLQLDWSPSVVKSIDWT
jgi:hypothetical protein